ncbi:hypothetical protein M8R20_15480 [Pseudomonas sp. R2.Fl]|nr:hypothetical protein [Pseudomonas sp. R2.Fl]
MIVLVGYVSIEGQTRKIAETIATQVEKNGDRAVIFNVTSMAEYALERPTAAILCAPIHAGRYPAPFVDFVRREKDWLASVPNAFVSVSLFIHSDLAEERGEAIHFPDALMAETGWIPDRVHHAAGAFRFSEYDFFKRWMMKRMAEREGAPTDAGKDHEFTDWKALGAFVGDFLAAARR